MIGSRQVKAQEASAEDSEGVGESESAGRSESLGVIGGGRSAKSGGCCKTNVSGVTLLREQAVAGLEFYS